MTSILSQTPSRFPWLLPLLFLMASLGVFGKLAEDVWSHEPFRWDVPLLTEIHRWSSPFWDSFMLALTRLGDAGTMALTVAGVLLWLVYRHRFAQAAFLTLAVGGAGLLNPLLKQLFHRARPDLWPSTVSEHGYGFPSGHAMGSLAVMGALAVLAWPTRWRWPVLLGGLLLVLGVGASRLYLGVHYPSDVLAGWGAGSAWVGAVTLLTWRYRQVGERITKG